jgi:hypothetical protein
VTRKDEGAGRKVRGQRGKTLSSRDLRTAVRSPAPIFETGIAVSPVPRPVLATWTTIEEEDPE